MVGWEGVRWVGMVGLGRNNYRIKVNDRMGKRQTYWNNWINYDELKEITNRR